MIRKERKFQSYNSPILTGGMEDVDASLCGFQSYNSPILTSTQAWTVAASAEFQSYNSPILTESAPSSYSSFDHFNPTIVRF